MVGLSGREIRFDPDFVAGLKIGYLSDWKRGSAAGDTNLDLGAHEVKTSIVSMEDCRKRGGEKDNYNFQKFHVWLRRRLVVVVAGDH